MVANRPSIDFPKDGRLSPVALDIQKGVCRLLRTHGFAPVTELTLGNGRRADVAAVDGNGALVIVEIKSSLEDFRSDNKWQDYLDHCDQLYFAVSRDFPADILPTEAGLIIADKYGGEILRSPPENKLPGSRRKAVLLRFSRTAALRLHDLYDPDANRSG
ncbi:MAG: MmcB family DNA repair protein [Methyloligellaceae bacterium]